MMGMLCPLLLIGRVFQFFYFSINHSFDFNYALVVVPSGIEPFLLSKVSDLSLVDGKNMIKSGEPH